MSELVIPCPTCGYHLRLPDRSFIGRKGRCPQCRLKFVMDAKLLVADADVPLMPPAGQGSGDAVSAEKNGAATGVPEFTQKLGEAAAGEASTEPVARDMSTPDRRHAGAPEGRAAGEESGQRGESTSRSFARGSRPSRRDPSAAPREEFPASGETVDYDESTAAALSAMVGEEDIPERFGRYRVLEQLGEGSMGAVYLVHDTELDRKVALKTPRFSDLDREEETERFYREARAAATLRHPGICQVFDVGEIDGTHFIAMEYIDGNPLSAFIKQPKPQPVRKIAMTVRKLAKALQEAHEHGIVHRDLKPDNIMIDEKGEPIITDFGLVRLVGDDGRLTFSGAIVGSPPYMSPEQINAETDLVGPASDIFSLGTITYELLTRKRPFRGSLGRILELIPSVDPEPPSKLRPDVDAEMEAICLKMMAKRISDRYASMSEVAEAVSTYLRRPVEPRVAHPVQDEPAGTRTDRTADLPVAQPVPTAPAAASADLRAANWVLSIGGMLKVSTESSKSVSVGDADALPRGPFHVVDVSLMKNAKIDDTGMKFFSELESLLVLRLSETGITDAGVADLSTLSRLTVLDLSHTKVTDAGLGHIAGLKGLKQLDLAGTQVSDAGLTHVQRLTGLHFLGLYGTGVTDAGVRSLAASKNLQFLGLHGTQVTDAGVAVLKKKLPGCTISR